MNENYIAAWYIKPQKKKEGPQELKWAVVEADGVLNAVVALVRELEELHGYDFVNENIAIVHAQKCVKE